jgi:hypothetical protein
MDKMDCVRKRITDVSNDLELMFRVSRPTVHPFSFVYMFTLSRGEMTTVVYLLMELMWELDFEGQMKKFSVSGLVAID